MLLVNYTYRLYSSLLIILAKYTAIQVHNIPLREEQRKHLSRNEDLPPVSDNTSLDKYLLEMSQPGHWADGIMLGCASKLYERKINVLLEDGSVIIVRPNEDALEVGAMDMQMPTLFIGFIAAAGSTRPNHYVLLQKKNDAEATSLSSLPAQLPYVSCCYFIFLTRCTNHCGIELFVIVIFNIVAKLRSVLLCKRKAILTVRKNGNFPSKFSIRVSVFVRYEFFTYNIIYFSEIM